VARSFTAGANSNPFIGFTNQEGAYCTANLIQGGDGRLYGVAPSGGSFGSGTVFRTSPGASDFTVLHAFSTLSFRPGPSNSDGSGPTGLIQGTDGWLYGTTAQGGTNGFGAIFKLSTDGLSFTNIHDFAVDDGEYPKGGLVQGPDGALYGTAEMGGANGSGTVYRLNPDGSGFAVLYAFTALNAGTNADGTQPLGGLVLASDGTLYGSARYGGPSGSHRVFVQAPVGSGTLFSIGTNGSNFTVLHAFTTFTGFVTPHNAEGASPTAALLLGQDGWLYGSAPEAGPGGSGTLFRLDPNGSNFTVLHAFGYAPFPGSLDASYGLYPQGGVVQGSDGLLYGAAWGGGFFPNGGYFAGTLYRLNPDGSGLALLHTFTELDQVAHTNADGAGPSATLLQANDGKIYGLTSAGGINGTGTLFSFVPPVVLEVSASNSLVILTWPASATNYFLETSGAVAAGALWTPLTNNIVTVSNSFRLTLSPTNSAAFFRLHRQ
jgi:uncharacterized repeat protein (TIGR03803 family)